MQRECWQGHILVMCQMSVLKAGSMFILANERDGKFSLGQVGGNQVISVT